MSEGWSFDPWPSDGSREVIARGPDMCARITFAAWPDHLAIQAVVWEPGGHDVGALLDAILARYAAPPARVTYASAGEWAVVSWFARSAFAPSAVVCGSVGDAGHYYDPIRVVAEPQGEILASVMADVDFAPLLAVDVTFEALRDALVGGTWLTRIVALRRASRTPSLTRSQVEALHWLAITDDASAVRQFAGIQASCMFADQPWRPSLAGVRAVIADPLVGLRAWGPRGALTADGRAFDLTHARHSARLALLWITGNLAWMTDGYHAPGMEPERVVGEGLRADLDAAARAFDAGRDVWITALVDRELSVGVLGLGDDAPMSLFDIGRYAVLRARRAPPRADDDDRRAWLVRSVEALVPPDSGAAATVLYGSAPIGRVKPSAHAATTPSDSA